MPYVNKRRFLDKQYGIRKYGEIFMSYSPLVVDTDGDITIKDIVLKGTVDAQGNDYVI